MLRSLVAVTVLMPVLAVAQDKEDPVAKRAELVQDRTNAVVDRLKEQEKKQNAHLQRLKKGRINKNARGVMIPANEKQPIIFPSKDAKKKAVTDAQTKLNATKDRIKKYKDGSEFYYGVLNYPPKIGDFGKLYSGDRRVNVKQVIDDKTMLVNVYYVVEGVKVLGRPGKETVVKDFQTKQIVLMVKNLPNKGATDGAGFDLPQVFEVTDTQTYKTVVGGSNTVFVIEPLDTKTIEEYLKKP